MRTIKEVKEMYKGKYDDIEVYVPNEKRITFHTDFCTYAETAGIEYSDDTEVIDYELMDEEDYDNSILINTSERANFEEWYDDKDAKVLCILISR